MRAWLGITFVVLGSVPYYALLDVFGLDATGQTTGLIFGCAGAMSVGWLALSRRRLVSNRWVVLSFVAFTLWWWIRWAQDPPGVGGLYDDFGSRAPAYMAVFALIPLLAGQLARTEEDVRDVVKAMAFWGLISLAVLACYWPTGSLHAAWRPIPKYSAILMAFDVGTGCLALLAVTRDKGTPWWIVLKLALVGFTLATMVRISERGPFLFFLIAFAVMLWRTRISPVIRLFVVPTLSIGALALSLRLSETYGTVRVTTIENYSTQTNDDRLALWTGSWDFYQERPILGWGGSLVGRPMRSGEIWEYSHVFEIDPALETGLIGFAPFLIFAVGAIRSIACVPRSALAMGGPLLLYAFLEAQVSGHVSSARHLLFLVGALCSVTATSAKDQARVSSGRQRELSRLGVPSPSASA